MLRHSDGDDLARVVQLNGDLEGRKTGHVVGLRRAFFRRARLTERVVNGVAGQRRAGLHVDLRRRDVLTHQRVKHGGIGDQVRAEARRLAMLRHADGDDLAVLVDRDLHLERRKARNIIGSRRHDGLGLRGFAAVGRSRSRENRFLVSRMRLDAQRIAGIGQHVRHGVDKRGRGDRRAANGVNVVTQRIGIRGDADELIHEFILADPAAQTGGLLQRADVGLCHIALRAHAQRDRDGATVALRVRDQGISLNVARVILAGEKLLHSAALGKALDAFDFLIVRAAREHLVERFLLRGDLLLCDRALCHLIGQGEQHGRDEREDEQTNCELDDITHSS